MYVVVNIEIHTVTKKFLFKGNDKPTSDIPVEQGGDALLKFCDNPASRVLLILNQTN